MAAADWIAVFRGSGWQNEDRLEPAQNKMLQFQFRSGVPIYLKGSDHSGKTADGSRALLPAEAASILADKILVIEAKGRKTFLHLDYLEQIVEWDEFGKG